MSDAMRAPARAARERRDWLAVVAWSALVLATVPLARSIEGVVEGLWGEQAFLVAVLAAIGAGLALVARALRRVGRLSPGRIAWLVAVGSVYVACTWSLRRTPVEALHFVQYGVLGALAFRALAHRMRDSGVYLAATGVGGIMGMVDEGVQWVLPDRVWDLRDIGFNFFGAALVQVAIAAGVRPAGVSKRASAASVRRVCRIAGVVLLLLGACLFNTPPRIAWYASRVPGLGFLLEKSDVMLEFGHLYDVPEIGRFRSRFAPAELARVDAERGPEAGPVLGRSGADDYQRFLREHTPIRDPFLHEARVHLFRRDRYLETAERHRVDGDRAWARRDWTVAWRENLILEGYFGHTLHHSGRALPEAERRRLAEEQRADRPYESRVSEGLITAVSERQLVAGWFVALAALFAIHRAAGRREERR